MYFSQIKVARKRNKKFVTSWQIFFIRIVPYCPSILFSIEVVLIRTYICTIFKERPTSGPESSSILLNLNLFEKLFKNSIIFLEMKILIVGDPAASFHTHRVTTRIRYRALHLHTTNFK